MIMIPLVCFSHSDYGDILRVQCDYLEPYRFPKYLCFNKNIEIHPFEKVLAYDDSKKYSKRLEQSLSQIEDEYILLFHDMDIVISMDEVKISKLVESMKQRGIDRIDLKNHDGEPGIVPYRTLHYQYNVNPSIWKRSSLLDVASRFDKCYRTIEDLDVQEYCMKFSICRLAHPKPIQSAFFQVTPWFLYMHITSVGKLIPEDNNAMCEDLKKVYSDILRTYTFTRPMKRALYGYD